MPYASDQPRNMETILVVHNFGERPIYYKDNNMLTGTGRYSGRCTSLKRKCDSYHYSGNRTLVLQMFVFLMPAPPAMAHSDCSLHKHILHKCGFLLLFGGSTLLTALKHVECWRSSVTPQQQGGLGSAKVRVRVTTPSQTGLHAMGLHT